MANTISFKIYLLNDDSRELEVRRFGIPASEISNFPFFISRVVEIFPNLAGKPLTVYWKDDEDDDIIISSNEELAIGLKEMKSEVKKIYVKVATEGTPKSNVHDATHPMVYCDGCNQDIIGFRFKCVVCNDYDLCSHCEQMAMHSEHPMLRIPNSYILGRTALHKIIHYMRSFLPSDLEDHRHHSHHRRRPSHDNGASDFGKKKRKCSKHESGPETDESEEGCHKKHGHKKRTSRCVYSQMLSDFMSNFDPASFINENFKAEAKKQQGEETTPDVTYLKSVGKTIASLLDPLGIDVDFDIRTKDPEGKNTAQPQFQAGSPDASTTSKTESQAGPSTSSTSQQKGVHFATSEDLKQKINEITKGLADQKMKDSPERDDWVSFEELKQDSEKAESGSSKASQENPSQASAPPQEPKNLYPNLSSSRVPQNPVVRQALDKMLSMGFTNDGDWLTHLLEAKNGDINQALELLAPHKGA